MTTRTFVRCAWALGWLAAIAAGLLLAEAARAQERDLEQTLELLSADAGAAWVAPIGSAFGSCLNSGWYRSAPKPKRFGVDVELGLVLTGSLFPDEARRLDVGAAFRFSEDEAGDLVDALERQQGVALPEFVRTALVEQITAQPSEVRIAGATIVGAADDSLRISYPGGVYEAYGLEYDVPAASLALPVAGFGDLADAAALPLAVPQLTVGTWFGTRATLRWMPTMKLNDELGDYSYFGLGLQHNPAVWFGGGWPVDLALSAFSQRMEVGTVFESRARGFGLTASKRFGPRFFNLTPYAGWTVESAELDVAYDLRVPVPASDAFPDGVHVEPVRVTVDGANAARLTLGASLRIGVVVWNLDWSAADYAAYSTGLSLAF